MTHDDRPSRVRLGDLPNEALLELDAEFSKLADITDITNETGCEGSNRHAGEEIAGDGGQAEAAGKQAAGERSDKRDGDVGQ